MQILENIYVALRLILMIGMDKIWLVYKMGDIPSKEWGVGTHRLPPTSGFLRLERPRENGSS